jgi:hypothetical protein
MGFEPMLSKEIRPERIALDHSAKMPQNSMIFSGSMIYKYCCMIHFIFPAPPPLIGTGTGTGSTKKHQPMLFYSKSNMVLCSSP